jgi:hypothetical protein
MGVPFIVLNIRTIVHRILTASVAAFLLTLMAALPARSQIGGEATYTFLNISNSARIAALGGNVAAIRDNDITLTQTNPSLITPEMHNNLSLSYVNYFTGNNFGYVMYSRTFNKAGSFVGSLQFMNYGTFTAADETGQITGEFSASEYALNIGWGRKLSEHFSVGATGKLIYSSLDTYKSFGLAVDIAGTYITKNELFTASLLARNIGSQIVPYISGQYEPLPFDLQIALSQRFKHIPFRLMLNLTNLTRWDLNYTDPTDPNNQTDPLTGDTQEMTGFEDFADNLLRHAVIGGEVTFAKVFSVRLGYNYQRRQEMKLYSKAGMAGFSYGFGLRVKMFNFSYAHTVYQAGGINPNYVTITANLGGFSKKQ